MGRRLVKVGSSLAIGFPCSTDRWRGPKETSAAVSVRRRDQEMVPSSWVSLRMVFINANSAMSGKLGDPRETVFSVEDWEGCLEVASAAWLLVPGRCLISKRHGRVRCLRRNRRELVISSRVRSPKILIRGL